MAGRTSTWAEAALREMGLGPIWRLRSRRDEVPGMAGAAEDPCVAAPVGEVSQVREAPETRDAAKVARPVEPEAGLARQATPTPQAGPVPAAHPGDQRVDNQDARAARIASLDWDALEADIRGCRACVLCERRKQAVPGVGDRKARWMLVGEGPGAEEDQRGEPFVGQAGRLLDNMLAAIGLNRSEDVYIANAVKCRPPHNRTPERGEIATCLPYLERQIALVQPRLLIALGRPAAQALLQREIAISAARGKRFERGGIPVLVTYHPAYLLRNPQDKAKAWEDLCFARRMMAELDGRD